MTPRKPLPPTVPYNDLDLTRWKELDAVWTGSLWDIPSRARGNGHANEYHGNFVPQIATQVFQRFSKKDDVVLDLFLGSGTSAWEALRLERRCIGVELKPELVEQAEERLCALQSDAGAEASDPAQRVRVLCGDSGAPETPGQIREALQEWQRDAVDLLMLHPPYADIIRFSDRPECLSNAATTDGFLEGFRRVAANGFELLRPGRFAVLVIGDRYAEGELDPLGFKCMQVMNDVGFRTRSIVVKNIEGNEVGKGQATNLWRYRALRGGFYLFKHEYVMIFDRARSRKRPAKVQQP